MERADPSLGVNSTVPLALGFHKSPLGGIGILLRLRRVVYLGGSFKDPKKLITEGREGHLLLFIGYFDLQRQELDLFSATKNLGLSFLGVNVLGRTDFKNCSLLNHSLQNN